jgi:hypothetical protein
MDFDVRKLPETFVRVVEERVWKDTGKKDNKGNAQFAWEAIRVEKRGGYAILVKGNPGHSIIVDSVEQAKALRLVPQDYQGTELRPRLINTQTGEECDERGVPLTVLAQLDAGHNSDSHQSVDVDTNPKASDEFADADELPRDELAGEGAVAKAIAKVE